MRRDEQGEGEGEEKGEMLMRMLLRAFDWKHFYNYLLIIYYNFSEKASIYEDLKTRRSVFSYRNWYWYLDSKRDKRYTVEIADSDRPIKERD